MKKAGSISLVLLIIAAILKISVVTHYCGGNKVVSKLSLSANPANCGMEAEENLPLSGTFFANHCCEDVVVSCGTDNKYLPYISIKSESHQFKFKIFDITPKSSVNLFTDKIAYTDSSPPPGVLMATSVDLSEICIFRI
jgi:hypothetical protein